MSLGNGLAPPTTSAEELPSIRFDSYKSDPLARFLLDRLRFTPKTLALAMLAWVAVVNIVLPTAIIAVMPGTYGEGSWHKFLLYLAASGLVVFNLLVPPVIAGYYLWTSRVPQELFSGLVDARVLKLDRNQTIDLSKRLNDLFARRWADKAALLTVMLFVIWYPYTFHTGLPHFGSLPIRTEPAKSLLGDLKGKVDLGIIFASPWILFGAYWLIMIVVRGAQTIWALLLTFNTTQIVVEPLHPDKCGGLRQVNRYAIQSSYLIAACGFGLGLLALASAFRGWLFSDYWLLTLIGLYIVLAPSYFFLTLSSAHGAMKTSKDKYLASISKRFQEIYSEIGKALISEASASQPEILKNHLEQLQHLDTLYDRTDAFPVWPLDAGSFRRFFGAVSVSIVPTAISIAINISGITIGPWL